MEQVYMIVGMVTFWGALAVVAGVIAILAGAYVRGLYWSISHTAWAVRNSGKRDEITLKQKVQNVLHDWNYFAMARKGSISSCAPNGSNWHN